MLVKVIVHRKMSTKEIFLLKKIKKHVSDTVRCGEELLEKREELDAKNDIKLAELERRTSEIERQIDNILSNSGTNMTPLNEKSGAKNAIYANA